MLTPPRRCVWSICLALGLAAAAPAGPVALSMNWDYNCLSLDEEGVTDFVAAAHQAGIHRINFRVTMMGLATHRSKVIAQFAERLDSFSTGGIIRSTTFDRSFVRSKPLKQPSGLRRWRPKREKQAKGSATIWPMPTTTQIPD